MCFFKFCLNRCYINLKVSVVRVIFGVWVDLVLDLLNGVFVVLNIGSVWVCEFWCFVVVVSKLFVIVIIVLVVLVSSDISVEVGIM